MKSAVEPIVLTLLAATLTSLHIWLFSPPLFDVTVEAVGIALVISLFIVWEFTPSLRALFFCYRRPLLMLLPVVAALFVWLGAWPRLHSFASLEPIAVTTKIGAGLLLGIVVRGTIARMFFKSVLGQPTIYLKALLLLLLFFWFVLVLDAQPAAYRMILMLGTSLGIVVHDTRRGCGARRAELRRALQQTLELPGPSQMERQALRLYRRGRARALYRLLASTDDPSAYLRLLQAASLFREGNHAGSLLVTERGMQWVEKRQPNVRELISSLATVATPDEPESAAQARCYLHLLLSKALAHSEMNEPEEMWSALSDLLKLRGCCVMANVTWALRSYEKHLPTSTAFSHNDEPLEFALRALRANRAAIEAIEARAGKIDPTFIQILRDCVPMSMVLLLDALGCGHLARGEWEPAVVLLGHCLENDPNYPAAFVHIGDCFLARSGEVRFEERAGILRDARMSYSIARRLDVRRGWRGTHLQKLIGERMGEVERLEGWPRDEAKSDEAGAFPKWQPRRQSPPLAQAWVPPAAFELANTRFEIGNAHMGQIRV